MVGAKGSGRVFDDDNCKTNMAAKGDTTVKKQH